MISTKKYFLVVAFLLLLPLLINLRLVFFGECAKGSVIYHKKMYSRKGHYNYTVIKFVTRDNREYELHGPLNVIYSVGDELKIYYEKNDPRDNVIFNFSGIYFSNSAFFPGILFVFWSALFFALRESPKVKLGKSHKG